MKVAVKQPNGKNNKRPTRTSKFLKFLVKICLLPVVVKKDRIVFKIASLKTLIYSIGTFGWFGFSLTVSYYTGVLKIILNNQMVYILIF